MHMRFVVMVLMIFIAGSLAAQPGELMVQGTSPDLHLQHAVAPKENWYSIGRLYNVSPKEIAPYNGVQLESPLSIGQQIKIPLAAGNFSQDQSKIEDEVFVPVYHIVQDQEWLYRISSNFNKVPVENLERWNGIKKEQAKPGMKLIVGYLKVKKAQSALASRGTETLPEPVVAAPTNEPVTQTEEKQPEAAERKVPELAVKKDTESVVKKEAEPVATKTTQEPKATLPPADNGSAAARPINTGSGNAGDGYFSNLYEETGKNTSGTAGLFKSTSGWQDGKYYALMNNVAIGAIVKITNTANNKTVYAKVLGQVPEMKESAGLAIRISDAAAAQLGATSQKFPVQINY